MTQFNLNKTMGEPEPIDPPGWIHPDQAMRMHQLKVKKRALQARMNRSLGGNSQNSLNLSIDNSTNQLNNSINKRKNPFVKDSNLKKLKENFPSDLDVSTDSVLFELIKNKPLEPKNTSKTPVNLSFANVLSKLEKSEDDFRDIEQKKHENYFPLDWTLNTKMRFMSRKPFPWSVKLKSSEQASGTTGFVRCLNTSNTETTLDTSLNARFHQCCLIWQHPSLPWLNMFPRAAGKISASLASNSAVAINQFVRDSLFTDWSESLRSLFHLLRVRQCPYFYVCANNFTALFRAAGICGISEVNVLITPTTRGFRQALKQEEIEYTMPLRSGGKRRSDVDSGCETFDSNSSVTTQTNINVDDIESAIENDDDDVDENVLKSLGIEDSEIKKINQFQKRKILEKESEVDSLKQSLVFVKGVEAQALFNFLINCKSAIATTGALAGVPPTLLSPVAFHGATLKPLKVRESTVHIDNEKFFSIEIKGPIMPQVLPSICSLIKSSQFEQFSVSLAQLEPTKSFSAAKHGSESPPEEQDKEKPPQSVFGEENLSDCGFNQELLLHFCNTDRSRIQVVESLEYSSEGYTWT